MYKVIRNEYHNSDKVDSVIIGSCETYEDADCMICDDVSDFRDHHDNDERIDWNIVDVCDDIGNCNRFEWLIEFCG